MEKLEALVPETRKCIFLKKLVLIIKIIIFGFCGALKYPQGRSSSIVWEFFPLFGFLGALCAAPPLP